MIPSALDKHFSLYGVRLADKRRYRGHMVYLADGTKSPKDARAEFTACELTDDAIPEPGQRRRADLWMKNGYFISAFAILRDHLAFGFPLYFEINHDLNLTPEGRQQARLNSAFYACKESMDTMINVGLLEDRDSPIIIPRFQLAKAN
jgi:hypothetical protein